MTQINLLPWREQARTEKKLRFGLLFAAVFGLVIFIIIVLHIFMAGLIHRQLATNAYLQSQLDQEKSSVAKFSKEKKAQQLILSQLQEAYHLQNESFRTVNLLNILANAIPDGVNLTKLNKVDDSITLEGEAMSNVDVTVFMENLVKTKQFNQPVLTKISANNETNETNKNTQVDTATKSFQIQVVQKE